MSLLSSYAPIFHFMSQWHVGDYWEVQRLTFLFAQIFVTIYQQYAAVLVLIFCQRDWCKWLSTWLCKSVLVIGLMHFPTEYLRVNVWLWKSKGGWKLPREAKVQILAAATMFISWNLTLLLRRIKRLTLGLWVLWLYNERLLSCWQPWFCLTRYIWITTSILSANCSMNESTNELIREINGTTRSDCNS